MAMKPIKALSLYQSWATLVACGEKKIETRSWFPGARLKRGEELAIHASRTFSEDDRALCSEEPFRSALLRHGIEQASQLPLGVVVAVARFREALPTGPTYDGREWKRALNYDRMSDQEYAFGNYGLDRWAWVLEDIRPIVPQPAKGMQGIWAWKPEHPIVYLEPGAPAAHAQHARVLGTPAGTNIPTGAARPSDGPYSAPSGQRGAPAPASTHLHTWEPFPMGGRYARCTGTLRGKRCPAIMDQTTKKVAEGKG